MGDETKHAIGKPKIRLAKHQNCIMCKVQAVTDSLPPLRRAPRIVIVRGGAAFPVTFRYKHKWTGGKAYDDLRPFIWLATLCARGRAAAVIEAVDGLSVVVPVFVLILVARASRDIRRERRC